MADASGAVTVYRLGLRFEEPGGPTGCQGAVGLCGPDVCVDDRCRKQCQNSSLCGTDEECRQGLCLPLAADPALEVLTLAAGSYQGRPRLFSEIAQVKPANGLVSWSVESWSATWRLKGARPGCT